MVPILQTEDFFSSDGSACGIRASILNNIVNRKDSKYINLDKLTIQERPDPNKFIFKRRRTNLAIMFFYKLTFSKIILIAARFSMYILRLFLDGNI